MGMPVSGCALPSERVRSAASACLRLRSGSSVMKQLYFGFNCLIRFTKCRVSSTLEKAPASRLAERLLRVALCIALRPHPALLDHLGHEIETAFHLGGNRLEEDVPVGFRDGILAQPLHDVQRMGHRLDAAGVHGLHLADELED